ncbi:hypothetical protein TWF481_011371 [Arthrobotrys musiformis]|uniref:F-box domain-containing protein n=1 Tax=Arthrobotrys musiformis TaxID=47236 RepID=A0AAV9W094_9PEZI
MKTSILSFPNEILAIILGDEVLSNGDIGRAERTCKLFQANIQEYVAPRRRYTFWVDSVDRPAWRLIRRLLKDPKLGETFVEINVKWERRIASDPSTWPSDWRWTRAEQSCIRRMCRKWDLSSGTLLNILEGKNSEALLPLLLCFTPKLKSLDLGSPDGRIVNCAYTDHELEQALKAIGITISGSSYSGQYWEDYCEESHRFQAREHELFLFDGLEYLRVYDCRVVGSPKLSPGLKSLEHFRIGGQRKNDRPFQLQSLFPIFSLPKIKSIHAFGLIDNDTDSYPTGSSSYKPSRRGPSSLKYLTLESHSQEQMSMFPYKNVKTIAKITRNLEVLIVNDKRSRGYQNKKEIDEKVGEMFLKYNQGTLDPRRLRINGGGFTATGEYDADIGRREDLARRRKLFEQAQNRPKDLNLKPSPLETLKPELLSRILSSLKRSEIFNLMLASKAFYETCYRHIWSRIALVGPQDLYEVYVENIHALDDIEAGYLKNIIKANGKTGIEYLEHLELDGALFFQISPSEKFRVLDYITTKIESGDAKRFKSLHIDLKGHDPRYRNYSDHDPMFDSDQSEDHIFGFLSAVKQYSEQKNCNEFSLHIEMRLRGTGLFDLCDTTKLTNLVLQIDLWTLEEAQTGIERVIRLLKLVPRQLKDLTFIGGFYDRMLGGPAINNSVAQSRAETLGVLYT